MHQLTRARTYRCMNPPSHADDAGNNSTAAAIVNCFLAAQTTLPR
ncbi:hypothetical protein [Humisphaera borealis]|nr:hypothetical protein [Humisphaera borealis]